MTTRRYLLDTQAPGHRVPGGCRVGPVTATPLHSARPAVAFFVGRLTVNDEDVPSDDCVALNSARPTRTRFYSARIPCRGAHPPRPGDCEEMNPTPHRLARAMEDVTNDLAAGP